MKSYLKIIRLHCILIIFSSIAFAQNLSKQELLEFYPYHIGNSWSYLWIYYNPIIDYAEAGRDFVIISQDTTINNLRYWTYEYHYKSSDDYEIYLERIDSITGDVFRINEISSGEEHIVDNIYANVGDTINISENRFLLYSEKMVVLSILDTIINNYQTTIREVVGLPNLKKQFFARGIGMLGSGKNHWIDSANVNGIIYADISSEITDIIEYHKPIGNNFVLFQNYPNPFNPTTIIEFSLPKSDFITLSVHNVLGEKVKTLVNNKLGAGVHKISFESHNLSSGIYIYKLESGEYSKFKKMILLK